MFKYEVDISGSNGLEVSNSPTGTSRYAVPSSSISVVTGADGSEEVLQVIFYFLQSVRDPRQHSSRRLGIPSCLRALSGLSILRDARG